MYRGISLLHLVFAEPPAAGLQGSIRLCPIAYRLPCQIGIVLKMVNRGDILNKWATFVY